MFFCSALDSYLRCLLGSSTTTLPFPPLHKIRVLTAEELCNILQKLSKAGFPFSRKVLRSSGNAIDLYHSLGPNSDFCPGRHIHLGPKFSLAIHSLGPKSINAVHCMHSAELQFPSKSYISNIERRKCVPERPSSRLSSIPKGAYLLGCIPRLFPDTISVTCQRL